MQRQSDIDEQKCPWTREELVITMNAAASSESAITRQELHSARGTRVIFGCSLKVRPQGYTVQVR